jgi:SAM-dependent methyltransferase
MTGWPALRAVSAGMRMFWSRWRAAGPPPPVDAAAFREFERAAHDRVAGAYHDFFEPVTSRVIDALLDAARVGPGVRVLDVATGPGAVAARAAARGAARVVGVDLAPNMVALAATLHPEVEFRQADAEALPFADASFDAVVCNFGIGHFPRPEQALAEFVRLLAPGGGLALSWWQVPERNRVNGLFFEALAEVGAPPPADVPAGPPPFRFSDDGELRRVFRIRGLEAVAIRGITWTHRLTSVEDWWRGGLASLVRAGATVRGQPADVQERVREAFTRLARRHAGPGGLEVPAAAKIVSARKAAAP